MDGEEPSLCAAWMKHELLRELSALSRGHGGESADCAFADTPRESGVMHRIIGHRWYNALLVMTNTQYRSDSHSLLVVLEPCFMFLSLFLAGLLWLLISGNGTKRVSTSLLVSFPALEGTWRAMNSTLTAMLSVGNTGMCIRVLPRRQLVP